MEGAHCYGGAFLTCFRLCFPNTSASTGGVVGAGFLNNFSVFNALDCFGCNALTSLVLHFSIIRWFLQCIVLFFWLRQYDKGKGGEKGEKVKGGDREALNIFISVIFCNSD